MRTDSPDHNAKGTPSDVATTEVAAHPPTACRHTVSGSFHSPPGVLFTFPSRYWCTIGHERVFSLGGWSPQIPTGLHVSHGTRDTARGFGASRTGLSPSLAEFSKSLRLAPTLPCRGPTTPVVQARPVWAVPRSLAATRRIAVAFFSSGYLDVSVPRVGFRLRGYWSSRSSGFPHSDTPGSRPVCGSPGLIAAYHVLHRLLVPRHPPCAFCRLTSNHLLLGVIPQTPRHLAFTCQRANC